MIIALAGRRIDDPASAAVRFPPAHVPRVEARLRSLFEQEAARGLVSSAACGADLLALAVAGALGLRRRIVLPFPPERFRETSVTDRPGEWGALYDRVLGEVTRAGDVVVLDAHAAGTDAYAAASRAIVDEAARMASAVGDGLLAAIVWEGTPRGDGDQTAAFAADARRRGLRVVEISTL